MTKPTRSITWMPFRWSALLLTVALPALAGERNVVMQASAEQLTQYANGLSWVVDGDASRLIGVTAQPHDKRSFWLSVAVSNISAEPIDVLPDRIRARGATGTLQVFSPEQVLHAQKKRDNWANALGGLAAAGNQINAQQAGYYNQNGSVNGRYRGNQGNSGSFKGNYSASGYDAAAAQQAQAEANAQNQALGEQLRATQSARLGGLDQRLLRRNTVLPGSGVRGDVLIALPPKARGRSQEIVITVPIGDIEHQFTLRVQD